MLFLAEVRDRVRPGQHPVGIGSLDGGTLPAEDLGWARIEVIERFANLPQQSQESGVQPQDWLIFWPHGLASDQIRQYAELPRTM
ncbi:hypothetical protein [Blastopirellula marina]|uniref:Uncharacterized protein n=1 Tax=Blastopirellula marina TaxID=124 RepID=A0A2S8GMY6_9BACT|nr:hypothetical protein [Blastopirellula marina]PQO45384.1 hypothetical protein C5Y93_13100 [Blastopirellula marina]